MKASTGLKAGLAGVVVAAGLAGKALYDIGAEFDGAYDKIRVGTGKTGKQLERLKDDFRNVVSSVPTDFDTAAEAITEVEKRLGLTGKALRRESKQFLELSRITDTDLQGNIKGVARAFEDWDVPLKQQSKQLDEFFRASQMSGASVEELTTLLAKFGSPLRVVGFGVEEATAMFASFEKSGVNIQTMLPGLKMALKNFLTEDRDPQQALKKTFEGIEDGTIKASKALEIFGQRAGADMVEAVNQGRFHLGSFQKQMETGNDTIRKAGKDTMDASENFQLLGNKLKVLLEPAATAVFKAVGDLAGALAKVNFKKAFKDAGPTFREIGDIISTVVRAIGPTVRENLKVAAQFFKNFGRVIKGVVEVTSGVLHGDFSKAWKGVKDIFSGYTKATLAIFKGMTAPARAIAGKVGDAIGSAFSSAWDGIKGIFKDGVHTAIGWVQKLADVLNVLPGVDIHLDGGGGGSVKGPPGTKGPIGADRRYSGGAITRPMAIVGEEAPQHPEWVIATNPAYRQNNLSYWAQAGKDLGVPGFAGGGVMDVAKGAAGAVGSAIGGGAGAIVGKLPKPHFPEPFSGLGTAVLGQVVDWLKSGFKSEKFGGLSGPMPKGGPAALVVQVGKWLQGRGWEVAENPAFGGVHPVHTAGSYHYSGRAIDFNWPGGGGVELSHLNSVLPALLKYHPKDPVVEDAGGSNQHGHFAYRLGGLLGRIPGFKKGGRLPGWVHGSSTLDVNQLASLAHFVGMPNPGLMSQIAMAESSGNPTVTNSIGARGLWQIIPSTAEAVGANYGSLTDPLANARAAAKVLSSQGLGAWEGYTNGNYSGFPKGTVSALGSAGGAKATAERKKKERENFRFGVQGGKAVLLPALGPTALSPSAKKLAPNIQGMLKSPGLKYAGKESIASLALERAEDTTDTADDRAVLNFQEDLYQGRKKGLLKKLARIDKQLKKKNTPAQRKKLLAQRSHVIEELGGVEGGLSGVRETRKGLNEAPEGEGGEGEETDAQRQSREATEANTAAIEAQNQELKTVGDELKRQTDFATTATATNSAVAWKALSDILSGNLGPKTYMQAQTAGNGSLGSY